jgi:hypothetical protein
MQSSTLTKRSKVIFCRVSEQEFTSLQARCATLGVPSVSECLRLAVSRLLANSTSNSEDLLRDVAKKLDEALQILQENSPRAQAAAIQPRPASEYVFESNEQ